MLKRGLQFEVLRTSSNQDNNNELHFTIHIYIVTRTYIMDPLQKPLMGVMVLKTFINI